MLKWPDKLRRLRQLEEEEAAALARRKLPPARGLFGKVIHGEMIRLSRWHFDGRFVALFLIIIVLGIALAIWWSRTRDFYEEIRTDAVVIAGNSYPVSRFRGVQSSGSPDMLHACFLIEGRILAPVAETPRPPEAPSWLKCYKADYIAGELAEGVAKAYLAEYNAPRGYDRIVAVSSGGRGFMWRQPNGNPTE